MLVGCSSEPVFKSFRGPLEKGERLVLSACCSADLGGRIFVGVSKGELNKVVSFNVLGESSNDEVGSWRKGCSSEEVVKGVRSELYLELLKLPSACEDDNPIQL